MWAHCKMYLPIFLFIFVSITISALQFFVLCSDINRHGQPSFLFLIVIRPDLELYLFDVKALLFHTLCGMVRYLLSVEESHEASYESA